jgi:hypothetical protein
VPAAGDAVKEHPILFTGEMVLAILKGSKTQTRRLMKPQPSDFTPGPDVHPPRHERAYFDAYDRGPNWCWWTPDDRQGPDWIRCPYGVAGDRLWVRETWGLLDTEPAAGPVGAHVFYRAHEYERRDLRFQLWRPSIYMPRWASRIALEVGKVRVQRLHEVTDAEIEAEGLPPGAWYRVPGGPVKWYQTLWDRINGQRATWKSNPWVWVIDFKRIEDPCPE